MQAPARILVVDDDRKLSRLLIDYLRSNGLEAEAVHDGARGLQRASTEAWSLIVLDVMLPEMDGFELLARLRALSTVPILMLTARGAETDRISGLDGGADDYVPKTASARELLSRINALLRRASVSVPASASANLQVGDLRIEASSRSAVLAGTTVSLTAVEFDLLWALAQNAGRVMRRKELIERVRDRDFEDSDRAIDVHIVSLRRKLGDDPKTPRFIRTVRSVGYQFIDPAQPL
jgi:two-component system response regulator CpxR